MISLVQYIGESMSMMFDMILEPRYKDLHENWSDEHAEIFIKGLNIVFNKLGIE